MFKFIGKIFWYCCLNSFLINRNIGIVIINPLKPITPNNLIIQCSPEHGAKLMKIKTIEPIIPIKKTNSRIYPIHLLSIMPD